MALRLMFFSCLFMAVACFASTIHLSAEFRAYSDSSTPIDINTWDPDWISTTDSKGNQVFVLEKIINSDSLPYVSRLGDAFLSINESGVLSMGLQHAEKLGETFTSFRIPQIGGQMLPNTVPYMIQGVGGDYSTNSWQFAGRVSLFVQ